MRMVVARRGVRPYAVPLLSGRPAHDPRVEACGCELWTLERRAVRGWRRAGRSVAPGRIAGTAGTAYMVLGSNQSTLLWPRAAAKEPVTVIRGASAGGVRGISHEL